MSAAYLKNRPTGSLGWATLLLMTEIYKQPCLPWLPVFCIGLSAHLHSQHAVMTASLLHSTQKAISISKLAIIPNRKTGALSTLLRSARRRCRGPLRYNAQALVFMPSMLQLPASPGANSKIKVLYVKTRLIVN